MERNVSSTTALMTAFGRAAGSFAPEPELNNPDSMAIEFLPAKLRFVSRLCRLPPVRWLLRTLYNRVYPGAGFYVLARTKHFDAVLQDAFESGIEQLLLLGAGYDTRPYRFATELQDVHTFELDHPDTGARKRRLLDQRLGGVPDRVVLLPIDFAEDDLGERLREGGFDSGKRTLALWEGVSMYLTRPRIIDTLQTVAAITPPGSRLVFDYIFASALREGAEFYGLAQTRAFVARKGEPYVSGIDPDELEDLIRQCGLVLRCNSMPGDLEATYLTTPGGVLRGQVLGYHAIALSRDLISSLGS